MKKRIIYILVFLIQCFALSSQENCSNGIDDDGDGLVDLNDVSDCACNEGVLSLFPNPSFEASACCPSGLGQMSCADGWIQASAASSDYFNTCGLKELNQTGTYEIGVPLPLPDGDGYVGIFDGDHRNNNGANKEYIGACLKGPIQAGIQYRLRFSVGFGISRVSTESKSPVTIVLYGTTDCSNLPFGGADANFGCPTNNPNWIKLAEVVVSGSEEWVQAEVEFTPGSNITAVALGGDCDDTRTDVNSYYYYLDKLELEQSSLFDTLNFDLSGDICDNDMQLSVTNAPASASIQWYKDGVAVVGETSPSIDILSDPVNTGAYSVKLDFGSVCKVSNTFPMNVDISGCPNLPIPNSLIPKELYLPTAFSPDGDGDNDIFMPVVVTSNLESFEINIFDKWGSIVYSSEDPNQGWDGKFKNTAPASGIYIYRVSYKWKNVVGVNRKTGYVVLAY